MSVPPDPLPGQTPPEGDAMPSAAPGEPNAPGPPGPEQVDARATRDSPNPEVTGYTPTPTGATRSVGRRTLPCPFGEYELLEEIARGGMGVVYKARQTIGVGERVVALKMIKAGRLASPEAVERFLQEARAAAKLNHPGIVPIYDISEIDEQHYFTMPLLTGGSLADRVREGPLPPRLAAVVVQQVAEAVQHAHDQGIIHRDLKPGNILLSFSRDAESSERSAPSEDAQPGPSRSNEFTPKVTDFGLARIGDSSLSVTGEVMGTPSYMPPEQARGQVKAIGPASDVYGLGAVLYCLLTGRPPFQSADPVETMCQVCADEPVPPQQLNPQVPRDLETVCLKCLEKEPGRRYGGAAELAEDLQRWHSGEPITARPVGRIERAEKWIRRRPVIAALSAAVVVALVTGASVSLHFGLQARQKEKEAVEYARSLEEQQKQTRRALEAVEENLAEGLLRPLGHLKNEKTINDFEIIALEDLASLPSERDRVRVLFITEALAKPRTAGQLGRRLEEALIAALGLRQDLRKKVMEQTGKLLGDSETPREAKVVCARLLAQLNCTQTEWVVLACETIVAEMADPEDSDPETLSSAFAILARSLPAERAPARTSRIVELAGKTTDTDSLRNLSTAFAALVHKLLPEQAGKDAATLAKRVVELAIKSSSPRALRNLSEAFAALADNVPAEDAFTLAGRVVELATKTADVDSLRILSSGFAALSSKSPVEQTGRQAANFADRILELSAKTTNPDSLRTLSTAFITVADKLPSDQAAKLANRIVEFAAKTTSPTSMRTLVEAVATLTAKLPAERTVMLAFQTIAFAAKTINLTEPDSMASLSKGFATLSSKLAADQAATLARQFIDLVAETDDADSLKILSEAFAVVSDKLLAKHAAIVAGRIVELATKTTSARTMRILGEAFAALSDKVPADLASKQATTMANQIVDLASKTTDREFLITLSSAFAALADKIPAEQAGRQATILGNRIVAWAAKTTDSYSLGSLATEFSALAGKLPAKQANKHAATLCSQVVELAIKTTDHGIRDLSSAFAALADKLPAEQSTKYAATLAGQIVKLAAETTDPNDLRTLSSAFAALPGKLSSKHATMLTHRILELATKNTDPKSHKTLSSAFAALAGKLPAEQAATLASGILEFTTKTTDPESLSTLSSAIGALCGQLSAEEAGTLAGQILELTAKTTDPNSLATLSSGFAALCGQLSAEHAVTLAGQTVKLAVKNTNINSLRTLSSAFVGLGGKRTVNQVSTLVLHLARMSHRSRSSASAPNPLDRLLLQLGTQQILEALKQPTCVGATRSVLLKHLSERYKRSFSDVWELVDYLKQHDRKLDFDSPFKAERFVPRATDRDESLFSKK